jgi:hypothetical protein
MWPKNLRKGRQEMNESLVIKGLKPKTLNRLIKQGKMKVP